MEREIKKLKLVIEKLSDKDFIAQECVKLKKENNLLKKENFKLSSQIEAYKWKEFYKKIEEIKII
jgi:hypothetical protein